MKINRVTFTGADNHTDIEALVNLTEKYPNINIEWGILLSNSNNRNRYPYDDFIKQLKDKGLNLALHLCGHYSRSIMSDGIIELPYEFFNRYQLNFNFSKTSYKKDYYYELTRTYREKSFILQYNKSNSGVINEIVDEFFNIRNTNILYDASGGRGSEISVFNEPFSHDIYTGYSGGLNPENIEKVCNVLTNMKNTSNIWIDMESGVRTNDYFDLDKVESVLKTVIKYN